MKISVARSCVMIGLVVAAACCRTAQADSTANKMTPQDVFNAMRGSFQIEKARGVHARYQFELSGPSGGQWWIEVNNGKFQMGRGKIEHPNVTFLASDRDWVALSNGTLSGTWAALTGRLKVRGDQRLAKKLDEIFP